MDTTITLSRTARCELPGLVETEIVVLAGTDPELLTAFVYALEAHLALAPIGRSSTATHVTIAVAEPLGAGRAAWVAGEALIDALPGVGLVRLPVGLDHKQRRTLFAGSEASVVAFVRPRANADLVALLAPLRRSPTTHASVFPAAFLSSPAAADFAPANPRSRLVTRRGALGALGGIGITVLLAACGKSSGADTTATAATDAATDTAVAAPADTTSAATIALAPELTEGPYYFDLDLVRSDVVEDRVGAKFALGLRILEASTGKAIEGAAVDIWHCDANGVYSGFQSASTGANGGGVGGGGGGAPGGSAPGAPGGSAPGGGAPGQSSGATDDSTFLRGTQLSDATGLVSFATIYPGWYTGRTVHIHVKVHVGGSVIHVGQLFFDDSFTDAVYAANKPYSTRAARDLRNDGDGIFQQGGAGSVLVVTKSGDAYAAELAVGVQKS